MSNFTFKETTDYIAWNTFAKTSCQYTIFFNSDYFLNIGKEVRLFLVKKGQSIKAGILLIIENEPAQYPAFAAYRIPAKPSVI